MVAEGGGQVREQVSPQVNNKPVIDFTRVLFQFLQSKLKEENSFLQNSGGR